MITFYKWTSLPKLSYEIAYMDIEPGPPFCPFDYLAVEKEVNGEWVTHADPSFLLGINSLRLRFYYD